MMAAAPGAPPAGGLSDVLKRGVALSAIGVVVCQIVIVAQTIALGRLLGPVEVGIFTAGSVMIGFLVVFAHSTLSQALIQREHDIEDAANTVLAVTFATGLLLGIGVLVASPLIGDLFHNSRVGLIAAATSGLMLLHSCSSVPDALMQRAFQFKQRAIIDPTVKIVFASVSIIFAAFGYGAWAMVIGSYASITTELVLRWWMAKWRPFRGRFSFRIWRELAAFSLPLLFDCISDHIRDVVQTVLVGRNLGTGGLGQYRYAYRIAWMPPLAIILVCGNVLFPAFSRISGDGARFRGAFLRALGWIWFAALPIGALLVVVGQPVVVLLLGDEWRPAGAATAAMAGIGLGTALASVSGEAIKGARRSPLLNWMTALGLVLGVGLVLLLLPFGLVGVGIAMSIAYLVVGGVGVGIARSVIDASFRDVVGCLAPSTLSALLATTVVFPLERFFVRSEQYGVPLGLASVLAECLLFTIIYLCVLRFVEPTRYRSVADAAEDVLLKLRGRVRQRV
jgi:O-antigen/teichoic acid export membrane protein